MDCKNFEQLIVEYIDGDLDAEMMQICSHHLSNCETCRELNENYKSIRSEIKKWEQESSSAQILESIRQRARKEGVIKETPFYKKLFNTPMLVPAFAAVIILVVVMNYGTSHVDMSGLSGDVSNSLNQNSSVGKTDTLDQMKPSALLEDANKNEGVLAESQAENIYMAKKKSGLKQSDQMKTGSKDGDTNILVAEKEQFAARSETSAMSNESGLHPQTPGKKISETNDTESMDMAASAPVAVSEMPSGDSVYSRQLDLVSSLQQQGKCDEAIKEAEKLLNSKPEPPLTIRKNAFVSQAECYEEIGNYNKALEVYRKLQEIEPAKSGQFSAKIIELSKKIKN